MGGQAPFRKAAHPPLAQPQITIGDEPAGKTTAPVMSQQPLISAHVYKPGAAATALRRHRPASFAPIQRIKDRLATRFEYTRRSGGGKQHGSMGNAQGLLAMDPARHAIDDQVITLRSKLAPAQVCLLRLSAIGDTCHALAVLRELQTAWPQTRFTWIIGKVEAKLMSALLPEVEFITFDKRNPFSEWRRIRALLARRRFDLLLHLQLSFRASLLSSTVAAPVKLGFDRARARELQWLFTNTAIDSRQREHVLDSMFGFVRACGIEPGAPRWQITLPAAAQDYAAKIIPDAQPTLLISPCSSHAARNWPASRYAAVADHAARNLHMRVVLIGGHSEQERRMGAAIESATHVAPLNQIGKDTLPLSLGLIARASVLLTPDSGPAHMASMVRTPVIGLYAATNPARSGPYLSRHNCVDRFDTACRRFRGKSAADLPWTTKIEAPGVMELIETGDVTAMLDDVMRRPQVR